MSATPRGVREAHRRWAARLATVFGLWAVVVGIAVWKGNHPDALLLGLAALGGLAALLLSNGEGSTQISISP